MAPVDGGGASLKSLLRRVRRSEFVRNVATLSGGAAAGQVVAFLVTPIITRLFDPDALGTFALFFSLSSIIGGISPMSYHLAVLLPKRSDEAGALVTISLISVGVVTTATFVTMLFFGEGLAAAFNAPVLSQFPLLLPLAVAALGMDAILRQWLIRNKQFRPLAMAGLILSVVSAGSRVLSGFAWGSLPACLIAAFLFARFASLVYLGRHAALSELPAALRSGRSGAIEPRMAREKSGFPLLMTPNDLLNRLSQESVVLLLGVFFGVGVVGLYQLGRRLLEQPSALLSDAVGQVYLQRASYQAARHLPLTTGLRNSTLALAALGIAPFGILAVAGAPITALLFGEEWREGGRYIQYLAPWLYLGFVSRPANMIFIAVGQLRIKLYWNVGVTVARALAILVGYYIYRAPIPVIALFGATGMVFNALYILLGFQCARKADREGGPTNHNSAGQDE